MGLVRMTIEASDLSKCYKKRVINETGFVNYIRNFGKTVDCRWITVDERTGVVIEYKYQNVRNINKQRRKNEEV